MKDLFIVVPAHNEEGRIHKVLRETIALGLTNIIVVNDASTDDTMNVVSAYNEVLLINHLINLGPGGATQTGIDYAISKGANYIATIDGDYQHDPKDLIKLYNKIKNSDSDLVIGSRFKGNNSIPFLRRVYNKAGNLITYLLTGTLISDSQSGLKIIKSSLAKKITLESNGFEFCIELIKNAISKNAKIEEIPIKVRYTKETMQKGQSLSSGFSMLSRLFSPFN